LAARRRNLYDVLGVAKDASDDAVKKAYRALARKHHPDVNPGDKKAEERFKEISEAYAVLSDKEKRQAYDEFGDISLEAGFDAAAARDAQRMGGFRGVGGQPGGFATGEGFEFDLEDLLGGMLGGRGRARGARRTAWPGDDLEVVLELDFLEAALGTTKQLSVARPDAEGNPQIDRVTVRIPPGVDEGGRIRVRGKGAEGGGGGPPGDLYARIRVRPHPWFRRDGRDVLLDLPVTVGEAAIGAKIEIPTLEGKATVTVPAGSDSGRKLRLRSKGIPDPRSGARGNLIATVQIRVPVGLDAEAKQMLRELAAYDPPGIRKEWET
jgi:DnaJ-class molecular chaperone